MAAAAASRFSCVTTRSSRGGCPHDHRPIRSPLTSQDHQSAAAVLVRKKSEIDPARELIRLATDAGVIIPLSTANMRETSALHGDRRYENGIAMAALANGWMMRHPLAVRTFEFTTLFARELGVEVPEAVRRPVFTLEPYAIFDSSADGSRLPTDDYGLFQAAHVSPSVIVDTLLDPERLPPVPLDKWRTGNQKITDYLNSSTLSRGDKKIHSYLRLWEDHTRERHDALALLGLPLSAMDHVDVAGCVRLLKSTTMVRLYGHLAMLRHVNPDTRWKDNDLNDMVFLSCAAAYADFVAAENQTAEELRQANKEYNLKNNVFPTLRALVDALQAANVQTDTERRRAQG